MAQRVLIAAVSVAFVAAQGQCFDKYQCVFHHDVNGVEYSWDLHTLCKSVPGTEYKQLNPDGSSGFYFNICGNTSQYCAPNAASNPASYNVYDSHGVAVQLIEPLPANCPEMCTDADTGLQVCCTGQCEILGTEYFQFVLTDPNNPLNGGVTLIHSGMPPDIEDPFQCPTNPSTGLVGERQLIIQLSCDTRGSASDITITAISEPASCVYLIQASTRAACGVVGDPYTCGYSDNPAHSFGFVVLGVALTIFLSFVYSYGDERGWWNSAKSLIVEYIPFLGSYISPGYGGASKGKFTSLNNNGGGVSAASPIVSGGYGTA